MRSKHGASLICFTSQYIRIMQNNNKLIIIKLKYTFRSQYYCRKRRIYFHIYQLKTTR